MKAVTTPAQLDTPYPPTVSALHADGSASKPLHEQTLEWLHTVEHYVRKFHSAVHPNTLREFTGTQA